MRALLQQAWTRAIPENVRNTLSLRAFGLTKVPMLFFCSPVVKTLNAERCEIVIALNRRTKNHVGSLYFGALCAGADCAAGLHATTWGSRHKDVNIALVFKEMQGSFLKRAESDVLFTCTQGLLIIEELEKALVAGTRANIPVEVVATCPDLDKDVPVARFQMVISFRPRYKTKQTTPAVTTTIPKVFAGEI